MQSPTVSPSCFTGRWLVLARMLVALGAAAIIPLSMAWVGDKVANDHMQEMLARVALGSTLGIVAGQLMGGLITDFLGWRWAFAVMAVLFGVVGVLLFANLRKLQHAAGTQAPAVAPAAVRHGFVKQALLIFTGRWSRKVLIAGTIEGAAAFGVLAIWASHLHDKLGLSLTLSGAIAALFGFGGMVYMASARPLIRRLGEKGLALAGALISGSGAMVFAVSPWWQLAAPACLFSGFGLFMLHNTLQVNAAQMAPGARGTSVSLFASTLFLGQSLGVLTAAALVGRIGSTKAIVLGGLVIICLGIWFSAALRKRDRERVAA